MMKIVIFCVLALLSAVASGFTVGPVPHRSIVAATPVSSTSQSVFMGRGDKRTKKGKIKACSHGKTRPSKAPLKLRQLKSASFVANKSE